MKIVNSKLKILLVLVLLLMPPPTLAVNEDTTLGATLPVQSGGLRFVGQASPNAQVTFLKSGTVIGTQAADAASNFDKTFPFETLGTFTYGVFATDVSNRQTKAVEFSVTIIPGSMVTLSDILLPPTFVVALVPIKRPQMQTTFGTTVQASTVTAFYGGDRYGDSFAVQTGSNSAGDWSLSAGRTLHLGTYHANAIVQTADSQISPQTDTVNFQVLLSADLNNDGRVNLTDFSILMFYYGTNTDKPADINDDGRVNLTDFSILLFYWTG